MKINKEYYEGLKKVNYRKVELSLKDTFEKQNFFYNEKELLIKMIIDAYILIEVQKYNIELKNKNFDSFIKALNISNEVKEVLKYYSNDEVIWMVAKNFSDTFKIDELISFILFGDYPNGIRRERYFDKINSLPEGLLKLVLKILDIKDDDNILELNSGVGNFEIQGFLDNQKAKFKGIETDIISNHIAILKFSLFSSEIIFKNTNILEYKIDSKVNKIFVDFPFEEFFAKRSNNQLSSEAPEWKLNKLLIKKLKEGTKAVSIVRERHLSIIRGDDTVRKEFIKEGLIETIILLPSGIFPNLGISVALIVFSKGNEEVRFIDASDLYITQERKSIITDKNIEEILELLDRDSKISTSEKIKDIIEDNYNLDVHRNIEKNYQIERGVEFKTVIKKIIRGAQLRANELDEIKSNEITPYLYLTLTNINDGIIEVGNNEQYLSTIPEKLEKYCIKNNSFLIAKIGTSPYKFAIAQINDERKILANGNIFIIELDEKKINPWYLGAFLASDKGIEYLKYRYKGNNILSLSISELDKMVIPLPSLEEQDEVAKEYIKTLERIKKIKEELEKEKLHLKQIFKE